MIDLLERAHQSVPDHVAVETGEVRLTYAELIGGAREVAAGLVARSIDRFAIVEHDAAWILRLLAGAALAGAEPCQYQPDTPATELSGQAAALGHDVVVTRRSDLADVVATLDPADLVGEASAAPEHAPDVQPLLIRTTGTTGAPKAARHDWTVLARTTDRVRPRPDQRWLLAYGPQQFAGTQVLLHVLASQATLVAPFPRQPRDGLAAILEQDVTCVSATPTYWRFLLAEARSTGAALPALDQVTLGGEASPAGLLSELATVFPSARVTHVYASTELGSVASVSDGRPGVAVAALHGPDNPDGHLKVVDGELWVRAAAGMLGYVGDDTAPRRDDDGWQATGDLVEVVGDRVEFRGRSSEVINVGGVKVHPLPVEDRIAAVPGVDLVRVFGRANALTGAIVAAEVVATPGVDLDQLRRDIKASVADLPRAWAPRSTTFVDAFETRGDKTVRRTES